MGTYRLLVQFSPDADRCSATARGMKANELVRVMTNTILNRNRTRSTTRSPKPLRHDTLTVFMGWTHGARKDIAQSVESLFWMLDQLARRAPYVERRRVLVRLNKVPTRDRGYPSRWLVCRPGTRRIHTHDPR